MSLFLFDFPHDLNFKLLSSGSNKVDDAIELYHRAANMFKMAKKWQEAGAAFCSAGNLHAQAGSRHDAATNYVDASNCYKKVNNPLKSSSTYKTLLITIK